MSEKKPFEHHFNFVLKLKHLHCTFAVVGFNEIGLIGGLFVAVVNRIIGCRFFSRLSSLLNIINGNLLSVHKIITVFPL